MVILVYGGVGRVLGSLCKGCRKYTWNRDFKDRYEIFQVSHPVPSAEPGKAMLGGEGGVGDVL